MTTRMHIIPIYLYCMVYSDSMFLSKGEQGCIREWAKFELSGFSETIWFLRGTVAVDYAAINLMVV